MLQEIVCLPVLRSRPGPRTVRTSPLDAPPQVKKGRKPRARASSLCTQCGTSIDMRGRSCLKKMVRRSRPDQPSNDAETPGSLEGCSRAWVWLKTSESKARAPLVSGLEQKVCGSWSREVVALLKSQAWTKPLLSIVTKLCCMRIRQFKLCRTVWHKTLTSRQ